MPRGSRFVEIYDTTLRDGAQSEGVTLSVDDKLRITRVLDDLGVHFIEPAYVGSSSDDLAYFAEAKSLSLRHAKIAAFGGTHRTGLTSAEDPNLRAILSSGAKVATIYGKSWDLHVTKVLGTTRAGNLRLIDESIRYLDAQGLDVIFDAEHFFDGYRAEAAYALQVLRTARKAGARTLVLCDTNGGRFPDEIGTTTAKVVDELGGRIGIHAHNDSECAVANSLAAVQAGARHVQGTINGYGERVGNANLISVISGLHTRGYETIGRENLAKLTKVSRYVDRVINRPANPRQPYVGDSAFAHKGGQHIDAVRKVPSAYEHIPPETVGNRRRILASRQSGKAAILQKAADFGLELDDAQAQTLVSMLKDLESHGYELENAEGTLRLRMLEKLGRYQPPFRVINYVATDNSNKYQSVGMELQIGDEVVLVTSESRKGLVDALRKALDRALADRFPRVRDIVLEDYRVADLDTERGTEARVGVLITFRFNGERFGTFGVSHNMLHASLQALEDSKKYGLLLANRPVGSTAHRKARKSG